MNFHRRLALAVAAALAAAAALAPAVASAGWSRAVPLSSKGEAAVFPSAAMTPSGEAVVVWWRVGSRRAPSALRAAFRPAGGRFRAPQTVSRLDMPGAGNPPSLPRVSIADDGTAVATWTRRDTSGRLRVAAAVRRPGGRFGRPAFLSPPGADALDPAVASSSGADTAVLAWSRGTANPQIQTARLRGAAFSPARTIPAQVLPGSDPSVAVNASGAAVTGWWAGDGQTTGFALASRSTAQGAFGSPAVLSAQGLLADQVIPALDDAGRATVAWIQATGGFGKGGIAGQVAASTGTGSGAFGPARGLSPGNQSVSVSSVGVATLPRGGALVALDPARANGLPGPSRVQAVTIGPTGRRATATLTAASGSTSLLRPRVAAGPDGTAIVGWERDLSVAGNISPFDVAVRPAGGRAFSRPAAVSGTRANTGYNSVAVGTGRAIAAFGTFSSDGQPTGISAALWTR